MLDVLVIAPSSFIQGDIFPNLPAAEKDATWIPTSLRCSGISIGSMEILTGNAVRKDQVVDAIKRIATKSSTASSIAIFFSSHGYSISSGNNEESDYYIHCSDTKLRDRRGTSLAMSELATNLSNSQANALMIFVDACGAGSTSFTGAFSQIAKYSNLKSVAILGAAPNGPASEGLTSEAGTFTDLLCEAIDKFSTASFGEFLSNIQRISTIRRIPTPNVFAIGNMGHNLFLHTKSDIKIELYRTIASSILSIIRRGPGASLINIYGPSGSGKTTLLATLHQFAPWAYYIDIGRAGDFGIEHEVSPTSEILPPFTPLSITALINWLSHLVVPVLIIDGAEDVDPRTALEISSFAKSKGVSLVWSTWMELPFEAGWHIIDMPRLAPSGAEDIAKFHGFTDANVISNAFSRSNGFVLDFLQCLSGFATGFLSEDLVETLGLIYVCGGYFDEYSFALNFSIEPSLLSKLTQRGLIYNHSNFMRIHDSAIKMLLEKKFPESDSKTQTLVIRYWTIEFGRHRNQISAYMLLRKSTEFNLLKKIQRTITVENLIEAAEPELSISDIQSFIDIGDFSFREKAILLDVLSRRGVIHKLSLSNFIDNEFKGEDVRDFSLSLARSAWWAGHYDDCRKIVDCSFNNNLKLNPRADLEIGICDFFEGLWSESKKKMDIVLNSDDSTARDIGWANLILGTIIGIRGEDTSKGLKLLHDASILLKEARDSAGLAIAYVNRGEVLWKCGMFQESEIDLTNALRMSFSSQMKITEVEAKRNKIQLILRWRGHDDFELNKIVDELTILKIQDIGSMEMMQVSNTLATYYLSRNDISSAEKFIAIADPLTKNNAEYDIYTKVNRSLVAALRGEMKLASKLISQAASLCALGGNRLAIRQARDDVIRVLGLDFSGRALELIEALK